MKKILIVDDEKLIRNLVQFDLEDRGFGVVTAESGEQALTLLQDLRPDLVILDVTMGGMDGLETCRRIRADERMHELPVMILSGKNSPSDIEAGQQAGADAYLTKPFRASTLLQQTQALIS